MDAEKRDAALKDLWSDDYRTWQRAVSLLKDDDDPELVPTLIKVLDEGKHWQRIHVAKVLGEMQASEAVSALMRAVISDDEWLAVDAAKALGKIKDSRAIPALVEALRAEENLKALERAIDDARNPKNRKPDPLDILPILQGMQDISDVRAEAAEALGHIGTDEAIEALGEALDYEPDYGGTWVCKVLQKIGTPEALDLLKKWEERTPNERT